MFLVISGSRNIIDYNVVKLAITEFLKLYPEKIEKIIVGEARGVDGLVHQFCNENNIQYEVHYAEWDKFGKSAGMRRNAEMINLCTHLLAIWDGKSVGTKNAIDTATRKKKLLHIFTV